MLGKPRIVVPRAPLEEGLHKGGPLVPQLRCPPRVIGAGSAILEMSPLSLRLAADLVHPTNGRDGLMLPKKGLRRAANADSVL
jgi:hypothetical protein